MLRKRGLEEVVMKSIRTLHGNLLYGTLTAMAILLTFLAPHHPDRTDQTDAPAPTIGVAAADSRGAKHAVIVVPNDYPTLEAAIRCVQPGEIVEWREAYFVTTIRIESRTPCDESD